MEFRPEKTAWRQVIVAEPFTSFDMIPNSGNVKSPVDVAVKPSVLIEQLASCCACIVITTDADRAR